MNDFAFVAILIGFFVLAALFVEGCDRIISSDDEVPAGPPLEAPGREATAA
jgi:hypothetical protein